MSHYIKKMAFVGEKPWHFNETKGRSAELTPDTSFDDFLKASGLDYTLALAPSLFRLPDGTLETVPNSFIPYCVEDGRAVTNTTVTSRYQLVQPREVFEFFRELCQKNEMAMETAGVLKGGALYWALARTTESFQARPGDDIAAFCMMVSSVDKSTETTGKWTAIRAQCANTVRLALRQKAGASKKVKHTRVFDDTAKREVKDALGLSRFNEEWADFRDKMARLVETPISAAQAEAYFRVLLRPTGRDMKAETFEDLLKADASAKTFNNEETGKTDRDPRGLNMLLHSYVKAPGAVEGNAYGAFQAATFYVDHLRGTQDAGRFYSGQFGQGAAFKDRALDLALTIGQ